MATQRKLPPAAFLYVQIKDKKDFGVIDIDGKHKLTVRNNGWYKLPLGKHTLSIFVAYDEEPWVQEINVEDCDIFSFSLPGYNTTNKNEVPTSAVRSYMKALDSAAYKEVFLDQGRDDALLQEAIETITYAYEHAITPPYYYPPKKKAEAKAKAKKQNGEVKEPKSIRKLVAWALILGAIALLFICGPILQMSNFSDVEVLLYIAIIVGIVLLLLPLISKNRQDKDKDKG